MKGNVFRLKIVGEIVDKTLESKTKISEKQKQKFFFTWHSDPKPMMRAIWKIFHNKK